MKTISFMRKLTTVLIVSLFLFACKSALKKENKLKSSKFFINLINIFQVFRMKKYIKKKVIGVPNNIRASKRLNLLKFLAFLKLKNKTINNFIFINNFLKKFVNSLNSYLNNKTSIFLTMKKVLKNNFPKKRFSIFLRQ